MESNLLTVNEYADIEGVSKATVYNLIKSGELKSIVKNGKKMILKEAVAVEIVENSRVDLEEVQYLRKRVKELENYTALFNSILEENRDLKRDNRKLIENLVQKVEESESVVEVELHEYLIANGFTKRERERFEEKLGSSKDKRVKKRKGKIYLDIEKYSFKDILLES